VALGLKGNIKRDDLHDLIACAFSQPWPNGDARTSALQCLMVEKK
jgi:hypothetical protein